MKNILVVESSPRGDESYSRKLFQVIVKRIKEKEPIQVRTRDLVKKPPAHLTETHLTAFFASPESYSEAQKQAVQYSEEAVAELLHADMIIIGIPMYNFSIPSALKAWIDHIVRVGRTFQFTAHGPQGLVQGKKVILAIATGGIYSEGQMKGYDFTENYMKTILAFLGMTDVTTIRVEGLAIPEHREGALEKAIQSIAEKIN